MGACILGVLWWAFGLALLLVVIHGVIAAFGWTVPADRLRAVDAMAVLLIVVALFLCIFGVFGDHPPLSPWGMRCP